MPFEKGDFILIDYTAKVKETGEIFDTTIEDVAKKEKLYKEGEIYEPKLIVTGEGWMLKAVDENLLSFELVKPAPVEVSPDKAFGPRDPAKVRLVPLRRLTAKGINPQIGARIEIDNKLAVIRTIGAGRVQLDFNPPLAGKTLVYEVTVQKKLETAEEKIQALIHRRIPVVDIAKFEFKVDEQTKAIEVNMPEEAFYVEGVQIAKRGIATDLQKYLPETAAVKFIETFAKKEPETAKTEAAPTAAPEAK